VGRRVAGRGEGVARRSSGVGCAVGRPRVAVAARGALARRVPGDRPAGVDRGTADDRARDVRAVDGAQAAVSVGLPDLGGGGVGLDPSAQVLPDLVVRSGAGRVDGAQADAADRPGDGRGDDTRANREGDAGEAVPPARGADRLDGDRGRCEVSDGCGIGLERRQGAGPGGPQARQPDRREGAAGAGSFTGDGSQAAGYLPDDPTPLRRGQDRGAGADRPDGQVVGAVDQGGSPTRGGRPAQGARAGREGQAPGGREAGDVRGSVPEGRRSDPPSGHGRADHRPDRVASRPGRPADPQGQAGQAEPRLFGYPNSKTSSGT
jgi:hypothetical protein